MIRSVIIIAVCIISLDGCFASRGAEGLSGGQAAVSYTAPLITSVRAGVTDHIEYRQSIGLTETGTLHMADIYLHTHQDSVGFNAGVTLGGMVVEKVLRGYYGVTAGYTVSPAFSVYSALFSGAKVTTDQTLAIGGEIRIPPDERRRYTLVLIPEGDYFFTQHPSEMFGSAYGSLTIGVVVDVGGMLARGH